MTVSELLKEMNIPLTDNWGEEYSFTHVLWEILRKWKTIDRDTRQKFLDIFLKRD